MSCSVRILAAVTALALLTGMSAPASAGDEILGQYSVHQDYNEWVFDADGKPVSPEQQFTLLEDVLTGEPRFKVCKRTADGGETTLYALYDLAGKQIQDWGPYGYQEGFGDYLIRMDAALANNMMMIEDPDNSNYIALWNYKTGKDEMPGVVRLEKLDDSSVLLHKSYEEPSPGVMRLENGTAKLYPLPKGYYQEQGCRGNIIASVGEPDPSEGKEERRMTLLSPDFTPIVTKPRLNGTYVGLYGPYLLYTDGDEKGILSEEGKPLYTAPTGEGIDYFDGELAVVDKVEEINGERIWNRRLVKLDGTQLADGYSQLSPVDDGSDRRQPAKLFLGMRGEAVELVGRDGKATASRTFPGLDSARDLGGEVYSFTVFTGPPGDSYGENRLTGLLDANLNVLVEAGVYSNISEVYGRIDGDYGPVGLLSGYKSTPGGLHRTDLMDTTGKVLAENLTQIGDAGPNRLAVIKGFSVGLMDWQGNWIGKQSLFDKLEDEVGEDFY